MKKLVIAALVAVLVFTGCKSADSHEIKSENAQDIDGEEISPEQDAKSQSEGGIGNKQENGLLDLTEMSSTMVYSEVFNIVMNPEE